MKTIFVSSFFGLIARNILATDFLRILGSQPDIRIIIFAPQEKKASYQKMFSAGNIEIEGVDKMPSFFWERIISALFLNASDTAARRIHRLIERKKYGKYLSSGWHFIAAKSSKFKIFRSFLRWLGRLFLRDETFARYFEKYQPDLVFATDIFEPSDVCMIQSAQRRGVHVIGMVRSWDNITTKGLNKVMTNELVVNTPKIKEEAVRYCDFKPDNVSIVGIPHYDAYVAEKRISKKLLFEKLALDPNKKTIFFAAPSDIYTQGDSITKKVVDALETIDIQIILRLYIVGSVNLDGIKEIPGRLVINNPGKGDDFMSADLTGKDAYLADLLYHSDVVVAFASTLAIDATVFNKPVIFVGFDGEAKRPYWKSLRRFYDYDHQRSILSTQGVKLAKTPAGLIVYLERYLANPNLDLAGRKKIIEERCWKLDGQSGKRLADVILKKLV
ncbi:MAG: hypothetical protein Q8Q95_01930 [bacterium]|nr:hypothetical protein [bacterium]